MLTNDLDGRTDRRTNGQTNIPLPKKPSEPFDNKQWVTDSKQLTTYLQNCNHCWLATNNGETVLRYDQLESFVLEHKKYAFILNTKSKHTSNDDLAHWFTLVIDMKHKQALLHDSLNKLRQSHQIVFAYLTRFCNSLNLKLNETNIQTQVEKNLTCGFHALWFVHHSHKFNIHALLQLKRMLLPYSIKHRERFIVLNTVDMLKITV